MSDPILALLAMPATPATPAILPSVLIMPLMAIQSPNLLSASVTLGAAGFNYLGARV